MDQWKRQLAEETSGKSCFLVIKKLELIKRLSVHSLLSSVGDDDAFYPDDPNSPEVLRVRQEQAYRSVGALQLRVEELTLEVTKVRERKISCL